MLNFTRQCEQWNWGVIGASQLHLKNVCPKLLIPSSIWLTIVNQPGWRKKGGLENIFAVTQMFTQVFDLAERSIKGIASHDSTHAILTLLWPP